MVKATTWYVVFDFELVIGSAVVMVVMPQEGRGGVGGVVAPRGSSEGEPVGCTPPVIRPGGSWRAGGYRLAGGSRLAGGRDRGRGGREGAARLK